MLETRNMGRSQGSATHCLSADRLYVGYNDFGYNDFGVVSWLLSCGVGDYRARSAPNYPMARRGQTAHSTQTSLAGQI